MTYPTGGQGYPPPSQRGGPYGQPPQATGAADPSRYPSYLLIVVVVLGFAAYLMSYGPMWNASEIGPVGSADITGFSFEVVALILAALLAAVALLPKQRNYTAMVAIIAAFGFLLAMWEMVNKPPYLSVGWALIGIVVLAALQAVAAIGALLLEAGVITAPQPRPKYDQQQYPPYGGYYPQPGAGLHQQGPPTPQQVNPRPAYPQYGGYPQGPANTGGFAAQNQDSGPPTPPTGFPAYSQPTVQAPAPGHGSRAHEQPTQQVAAPHAPTQHAPTQQAPVQGAPSQQAGTPQSSPPPS